MTRWLVVDRFGFFHHVVGREHAVHCPRRVHRRRSASRTRAATPQRRVVVSAARSQSDAVRPEHRRCNGAPRHRQRRDRGPRPDPPSQPARNRTSVRKRALVQIAQSPSSRRRVRAASRPRYLAAEAGARGRCPSSRATMPRRSRLRTFVARVTDRRALPPALWFSVVSSRSRWDARLSCRS